MSVEYADRPVNIAQLDGELRVLALPGYAGISRMLKRRGPDNHTVASAPYLLVQVDNTSPSQKEQLDTVINNHIPGSALPPPSTRAIALKRIREELIPTMPSPMRESWTELLDHVL